MVHRRKKEYLSEARVIAQDPTALAYHLEKMDKFFEEYPDVKEKWSKFVIEEMSGD